MRESEQDPAEESAEREETRLILQQYPAKRGKARLKQVWTVDRYDGKWDIFEGKVLPKAIKGKEGRAYLLRPGHKEWK